MGVFKELGVGFVDALDKHGPSTAIWRTKTYQPRNTLKHTKEEKNGSVYPCVPWLHPLESQESRDGEDAAGEGIVSSSWPPPCELKY